MKASKLFRKFYRCFETVIEISRIKVGERQTIERLISKEVCLFAQYLKNEILIWNPRIDSLWHNSTATITNSPDLGSYYYIHYDL